MYVHHVLARPLMNAAAAVGIVVTVRYVWRAVNYERPGGGHDQFKAMYRRIEGTS